MQKLLVIALISIALLSCNNSSSGGSDIPGVNLGGGWLGTITADGGAPPESFFTDIDYLGSDSADGPLVATITFCEPPDPACAQASCPESAPFLTGTQRGLEIFGNVRGGFDDFMTWTIEADGNDRLIGRYEYIESVGGCLGETGVVEMIRAGT